MLIHSSSHDTHDEAIESARAAGRLGATRLPDTVLFHHGRELTDTGVMKCLDALEEGQAERDRAKAQVQS